MSKMLSVSLSVAAVLLAGAAASHAALVSADPDKFPSGASIKDAIRNLTLTRESYAETMWTSFALDDSSHYPYYGWWPHTFGWDAGEDKGGLTGSWFERAGEQAMLKAAFDVLTDFVSIDVLMDNEPSDPPEPDVGVLYAYDTAGNLLETVFSEEITFGFQTLSITRPTADIAYVIAGGSPVTGDDVHLTRLVFNDPTIPEPASLSLLALGALALLCRRRTRAAA